jgi:anti-anti-sigma factor
LPQGSIELEIHDDLIVMRVSGEMSTYLLDELRQKLSAAVAESGIYRVLINMKKIDYVTSKDLGVMVQIHRFLANEREKHMAERPSENIGESILALSDLAQFITDIMQTTRLETVFKIYPTEEDALKELCTGCSEGKH